MNSTFANSGQTFEVLLRLVSLVDAWREGSQHSLDWTTKRWPPDWTQNDVKVWGEFLWSVLHSTGMIGDVYFPILYHSSSGLAVRWPDSRAELRWVLTRQQVEGSAHLFMEDKYGLVFRKSKEAGRRTPEELFLATANDQRVDRPYTDLLKLALDTVHQPTALGKLDPIPARLQSLYPEEELVVLPCCVGMSQGELAKPPFALQPFDFRKGTSLSLREAIFSLTRARMDNLGLEIPAEAREFSPEEVRDQVLAREGASLVEKFLNVPPARERVRARMLREVSRKGGFSPQQWELLDDLADIECTEEGVQALKDLAGLPRADRHNNWSQILNQALSFIREEGSAGGVLLRCTETNCWNRYLLTDRRIKFCPDHRRGQVSHAGSAARRERRLRERHRTGDVPQKEKWAKQKRGARARPD